MVMLTLSGAVPGLEKAADIFTSTTYNALEKSTNLQTVPILMIQLSMIITMKIGVSLVGMVNSCCNLLTILLHLYKCEVKLQIYTDDTTIIIEAIIQEEYKQQAKVAQCYLAIA